MEVDYNGKGEFLTHSEGQPQAVSLTLSLQETEIMTKNRIKELFEAKYGKTLSGGLIK